MNAGPYAGVQYIPGEPIVPSRPNEGSVKRRNEKKRMRQRRAFILVCVLLTSSPRSLLCFSHFFGSIMVLEVQVFYQIEIEAHFR